MFHFTYSILYSIHFLLTITICLKKWNIFIAFKLYIRYDPIVICFFGFFFFFLLRKPHIKTAKIIKLMKWFSVFDILNLLSLSHLIYCWLFSSNVLITIYFNDWLKSIIQWEIVTWYPMETIEIRLILSSRWNEQWQPVKKVTVKKECRSQRRYQQVLVLSNLRSPDTGRGGGR